VTKIIVGITGTVMTGERRNGGMHIKGATWESAIAEECTGAEIIGSQHRHQDQCNTITGGQLRNRDLMVTDGIRAINRHFLHKVSMAKRFIKKAGVFTPASSNELILR